MFTSVCFSEADIGEDGACFQEFERPSPISYAPDLSPPRFFGTGQGFRSAGGWLATSFRWAPVIWAKIADWFFVALGMLSDAAFP